MVASRRRCGDCKRTGQKFSSPLFGICTACEKAREEKAGPHVRVLRVRVRTTKRRAQPKQPRHRRLSCQRCGTTTSARGYRVRAELCAECWDATLLGLASAEIEHAAIERGGDPGRWRSRHTELFRERGRRGAGQSETLPPFSGVVRCPRQTCQAQPRRIFTRHCRCGTANGLCEALGQPHVHRKCQNCTYEWLEQPEGV